LLHRLRNRPSGDASPLVLLLDEFGDAGRIPNMAQALATYRSKGVAIVAGVQSFALMESVYGETGVARGPGRLRDLYRAEPRTSPLNSRSS
jgi:type IV secretory pathway TraG/TraD family ATPase VirD4